MVFVIGKYAFILCVCMGTGEFSARGIFYKENFPWGGGCKHFRRNSFTGVFARILFVCLTFSLSTQFYMSIR